jgi:hypothetical protein
MAEISGWRWRAQLETSALLEEIPAPDHRDNSNLAAVRLIGNFASE